MAATVARVLPLYGGTDADFADMGPVPEYVRYFRSKRLPLHRLSSEVGLYTAPAYVLWVTPDGLDDGPVAACFEELARFGKVVIDASDQAAPDDRFGGRGAQGPGDGDGGGGVASTPSSCVPSSGAITASSRRGRTRPGRLIWNTAVTGFSR